MDRFLAALEQLRPQQQDRLSSFRDEAWKRFLKIGLPDRSFEAFRYLPFSRLYDQTPELNVPPTPKMPKEIVSLPLSEAILKYQTFLFARMKQEESDPFALLSAALMPDGIFLYVPPNITVTLPPLQGSRLHLYIGAHSQVEMGTKDLPLFSFIDAVLEEGAMLHHTHRSSEGGFHFDAFRYTLKRSSKLTHIAATSGGECHRSSYFVTLAGEGSSATVKGISLLDGQRHSHTHVVMEHQAPHTHSEQLFKGLLDGASRCSFEGKILVQPMAQKTQAYQLNQNLLLGPHPIAYSKPNLEIFADDVKASHGSTVGQLSEAELFYLQTRGLSLSDAKSLLISGFCREILGELRI